MTPTEIAARVDWQAAGDETLAVLADYLRADTRNPPGNEVAGIAVLERVLDAEHIEHEVVPLGPPGRASLIARVEGGDLPPLCLMSHLDVTTVEPERWTHPPFSAEIADGALWGRGALDMKSLGAVELMTLVWLHRLEVPLDRDVILLVTADEEVDNQGVKQLAGMWDQIGCDHVINEGGLGVADVILDGQTVFPISVAEKGHLWLRMVAHGEPGHGSTPKPDEAPDRLVRALDALEARHAKPQLRPAMVELLHRAGAERGGLVGAVLRSKPLVRALVVPRLMKNPVAKATITDTVHVTGFGGALEPNVIPSEAWATLDCRLLPGSKPEDLLAEITALVDDPQVTFEVLTQAESHESPWDDPLFDALAVHLVDGRDHVVAGPIVSIGSTDSDVLRPLGVIAYGVAPFEIPLEQLAGMHGDDERIAVDQVGVGLRRFFAAIVDYTTSAAIATPRPGSP
jgi:acetylornithine deacetylase/succinyl-diaminopimelate desuccinylase-like protein